MMRYASSIEIEGDGLSTRDDIPSETMPVLPLKQVVVFPDVHTSLLVGRPRSLAALEATQSHAGLIFLVTQRGTDRKEPGPEDLYEVGTIAQVVQTLRLPDGNIKVVLSGQQRGRIAQWEQDSPYIRAEITPLQTTCEHAQVQHLTRTVKDTFEAFQKHNRDIPSEMLLAVNATEDPSRLADMLVDSVKSLRLAERQELLETLDAGERLERLYRALQAEIEFLQVERKLRKRIKKESEQQVREDALQRQMRDIQRELGEKEGQTEIEELNAALSNKSLPAHARSRAEKEIRKLSQMNPMSAEATVLRNYLDCLIDLPWIETTGQAPDLISANDVLDSKHHGLEKVKERILEHLAVGVLVEQMQGPILCLVGPPGVGKTSLARSIALAMGRPFVRLALGGVRDEAEIRGHRRTYIGAMPGKLIQGMRRAGSVDPVILLDEVDKMSSDIRGDPASALLEVLDPEQNHAFNDHYLDLDYDLSKVTFICTANSLSGIPLPLMDRLEILQLSGYTDRDKLEIAKNHLLPKQLEKHGIDDTQLTFTDDALLQMALGWTLESGVRDLERQLAKVCRKVARRVVEMQTDPVHVTTENLSSFLGKKKVDPDLYDSAEAVGFVKGLAYNQVGGCVLDIEVAAVPGKGQLKLTGKPGDILKESSFAVFTYVRSRADALGVDADFHEKLDFHIHYPAQHRGVEGPSAGAAMAVALISALTGLPTRLDTAMTGELSLRGRILPIGGLKEKLLAAHRRGISRVLIPKKNLKDLEEVPEYIQDALDIIPVDHMDRVLKEALATPGVTRLFATYTQTEENPSPSP